jgi:hypothetical protein
VGAAKPLPRDFNLLVSRSVFVHGPQRIFEGPEVPPTTQPGNTSFQPSRPERTLLFNGSTRTEGEWVAFIEDTVASRVLKLKVGEPIARGKITAITLSSLNYDANGKSTLVAIGQNRRRPRARSQVLPAPRRPGPADRKAVQALRRASAVPPTTCWNGFAKNV